MRWSKRLDAGAFNRAAAMAEIVHCRLTARLGLSLIARDSSNGAPHCVQDKVSLIFPSAYLTAGFDVWPHVPRLDPAPVSDSDEASAPLLSYAINYAATPTRAKALLTPSRD